MIINKNSLTERDLEINIFIPVINRNHRSTAPNALLSPMANQLMNTTTTRQVNKVKPNVNRAPPDT